MSSRRGSGRAKLVTKAASMWQAAGQREASMGSTPGLAREGRRQGEETDGGSSGAGAEQEALGARREGEGLGGREQRGALP